MKEASCRRVCRPSARAESQVPRLNLQRAQAQAGGFCWVFGMELQQPKWLVLHTDLNVKIALFLLLWCLFVKAEATHLPRKARAPLQTGSLHLPFSPLCSKRCSMHGVSKTSTCLAVFNLRPLFQSHHPRIWVCLFFENALLFLKEHQRENRGKHLRPQQIRRLLP